LRRFSFGGYGLALAALALVVFGAIECPPIVLSFDIVGSKGNVFVLCNRAGMKNCYRAGMKNCLLLQVVQ